MTPSEPTHAPDGNDRPNSTPDSCEAVDVPAYLIVHPPEKRKADVLVEDPQLALTVADGWAVFSDHDGICLAIPAGLGAHIQRVDEPQDPVHQEPAPQKE